MQVENYESCEGRAMVGIVVLGIERLLDDWQILYSSSYVIEPWIDNNKGSRVQNAPD